MAHSDEKRREVRAAFVFKQMPLESAALTAGVPIGTARRWKREARDEGDCWDKAQGAQMLAGGSIENVVRQTLAAVVQQVQATVEEIQLKTDIKPGDKVQMLASLADAYHKLSVVSKKLIPETSELATAMEVVQKMSQFIRAKYPKHLPAFAEILEPFGDELVKVYG